MVGESVGVGLGLGSASGLNLGLPAWRRKKEKLLATVRNFRGFKEKEEGVSFSGSQNNTFQYMDMHICG